MWHTKISVSIFVGYSLLSTTIRPSIQLAVPPVPIYRLNHSTCVSPFENWKIWSPDYDHTKRIIYGNLSTYGTEDPWKRTHDGANPMMVQSQELRLPWFEKSTMNGYSYCVAVSLDFRVENGSNGWKKNWHPSLGNNVSALLWAYNIVYLAPLLLDL
jgi:hypothetical protein